MKQKISVEEMKAVAEAAITARQKATDARTAATDAGGADETLNAAADAAEREATEANDKAQALSQQSTSTDSETKEKRAKLKRKQGIIAAELERLGPGDDDDEDDDEDGLEDPSRPVTVGDLRRMEAQKAAKTTLEMADAIQDPVARDAVKAALKRVVPSGNSGDDFSAAVAIANREKNSKVLEEIARRGAPTQHRNGAGAPPKPADAAFVPTEEEAKFIKAGWLTEDDVKKARARA